MSTVTQTIVSTVTQALSTSASPTSTNASGQRVASQAGVFEGLIPVVWNPKDPIILFIIQASRISPNYTNSGQRTCGWNKDPSWGSETMDSPGQWHHDTSDIRQTLISDDGNHFLLWRSHHSGRATLTTSKTRGMVTRGLRLDHIRLCHQSPPAWNSKLMRDRPSSLSSSAASCTTP